MKAILQHAYGGPESLRYEDSPTPSPKAGEVLVRVRAGRSDADRIALGAEPDDTIGNASAIAVYSGARVLWRSRGAGEGVSGVSVGEDVYGMNDWFGDGAQAEYCLARVTDIARKPSRSITPKRQSHRFPHSPRGKDCLIAPELAAGQHVLIHGAAGGSREFRRSVRTLRGVRVSATVSAANSIFARELGS